MESDTNSKVIMPRSESIRSIRKRLFILLLRAFGSAVAFLVLFSLLVTGFILTRPARTNPLFQLPITSGLESYYAARGNWNGVGTVFKNSSGIESSQWQNAILVDGQNHVIEQNGQPVNPSDSVTYHPSSSDVAIPLKVNGAVVGTLVLQGRTRPSEIIFAFRYLLPIILFSLVLAVFATLIGLVLSRRVVTPLAEVIASAEEIANGNLQARVNISKDPDVIADLSESFNKMAGSLEQNDRERREMLADIAHELRTPLSVLRGRLEGIMDGIYPTDQSHIGPALEETYLLERLVEDLRLLTLAESHQLPFEKREVDLVEIAQRSIGMFQPEADETKVHLDLRTTLDKALVIADPLRTEQAIGNLLSNALRYAPESGHVWIEIAQASDEMAISVNDDGSGVAEEDLPSIFKRFWRGEKSRSRSSGGAGLGLAITKLLVEEQNGRIEARNLPGRGLQITVFFKSSPEESTHNHLVDALNKVS
jgi:signal transduction histidine kinase